LVELSVKVVELLPGQLRPVVVANAEDAVAEVIETAALPLEEALPVLVVPPIWTATDEEDDVTPDVKDGGVVEGKVVVEEGRTEDEIAGAALELEKLGELEEPVFDEAKIEDIVELKVPEGLVKLEELIAPETLDGLEVLDELDMLEVLIVVEFGTKEVAEVELLEEEMLVVGVEVDELVVTTLLVELEPLDTVLLVTMLLVLVELGARAQAGKPVSIGLFVVGRFWFVHL
jgi:hypothetical protein